MNQNTIEKEIIHRARAVLGLRGYKKPEFILLARTGTITSLPPAVLALPVTPDLIAEADLVRLGKALANATIERGIHYE